MKNTNNKKNKSRIYLHIEHNESFAVISAYRYNKDVNQTQHAELKSKTRSLGLGFTEMKGGFIESGNKTEAKALFVANIMLKDAIKLGNEFEQQSILFIDENGLIEIEMNNKSEASEILNTFSISEDKDKFANVIKVLKYYFAKLLSVNEDSYCIYVKEIEPTSFNRVAYNSHIPLAELNLDDVR